MADIRERWQSDFAQMEIESVRDLLQQDPTLVDTRVEVTMLKGDIRRWGPLFVASNHLRDLEKIVALVEAGARLENSELGTHWPSEDYAINRYLVDRGIDVNQPSYLGFHAIGVTGLDSFYLMLENGLDPNFAWPYNGETCLHVQAREDEDASLARAFSLIAAGADVNAQGLTGLDDEPIMDNEHFVQFGRETPLHFAARLGNIRQTRLLLEHGADPTSKTVSRMIQPKEFAPWEGEVTTLIWNLPEYRRVLFEPYEGETPLDMARRAGHEQIADLLEAYTRSPAV